MFRLAKDYTLVGFIAKMFKHVTLYLTYPMCPFPGKPERYSRQAFEMKQSQLRDRVEILGDLKRDMDNFLDLVRVQIALSNQQTNRTFEDDDLAISNIELLSG